MPAPDDILANWKGIIDDDFVKTIRQAFDLPNEDQYVYRAESFAMTLGEIEAQVDKLKYKYQSHGEQIEVSPSDITAYTSIFSPTTDTSKALTTFSSNAKKSSPRETAANYLQSRRKSPFKVQKSKTHVNPYLDFWTQSCHLTAFLGPLLDPSYADPVNSKRTHPILPVFYHHFGCVAPTYEALHVISVLGDNNGVIDMASGNGYWTYMLRRMSLSVTAVDSMVSEYRTMWIPDTVKADGVDYLKKNGGGKGKILLMVYMVTSGNLTERIVRAYKGDTIVVVGTQNRNRYTCFSDCTVEEWFEKEMTTWEMICRIPMPSFAGKDEGMFVWKRKI